MLGRLGAVQQDRVAAEGKAGVEVQLSVVIHEDRRVELEGLTPLADRRSVVVGDVAVEFVFSAGRVRDGDGDHLGPAHEIVEIEPSVRALHHIRGCEAVRDLEPRGCRVLLALEDLTFVPPVAEVVDRRGPADVVAEAEVDAVEEVVGPVDVDAPVHDVRLGVRHVLPAGKVGVEGLLCFHFLCPPYRNTKKLCKDYTTKPVPMHRFYAVCLKIFSKL